jgi:hypothetical protein
MDPNSPDGTMSAYASRYGLPNPEAPPMAPNPAARYGLNPDGAPPSPVGRYGRPGEGGISPGVARRYGDTTGERPGGVGRYGGGDRYGGGGPGLGGIPRRPIGGVQPGYGYEQPAVAPGYPAQTAVAGGATPGRSALQTILDEKPLRVTLLIHVVKLLPKESKR